MAVAPKTSPKQGCLVSSDEVANPPPADLTASLSEWTHGVDECESFLLEQLNELDTLRATVAQREEELAAREEQLALDAQASQERWQKLEQLRSAAEQGLAQVQLEAQRLAQARAEVVAMRAQLEQSRISDPFGGIKSNKTPNRSQTRQWEADRARMEQELQTAREQVARLSITALELAEARRETAELRRQLLKQQQRLMLAKGHFNPEQHGQLRVLEVERECLARELDSAQQHLRELQERMSREQKQISGERSTWTVELQKLREAVERQAAILSTGVAPSSSMPTTVAAPVDVTASSSLTGLLSEIEQMQAELKLEKPVKSAGLRTKT
jgi:DNA repair exonuclease SbcCD ATPase subunit